MSDRATNPGLKLRRATPADVAECGRIAWEVFNEIADRHSVPREFPPDPQAGVGLLSLMFTNPKFYCIVAEQDGRIIGSNCMSEANVIAGIGPICVDLKAQNSGAGRAMMEDVLARYRAQGFPGVRLMQAGYHMRSMSLYTKLGFVERETTARMQGPAIGKVMPGYSFRVVTEADLPACNALCFRIHGHDRAGELANAAAQQKVIIAQYGGRIVGYTTGLNYFGHTVAENNRDLIALLAHEPSFEGTGINVPIRNHEVFQWCLNNGLRALQLNTLMTVGMYHEPQGAWLPSIMY